MYKNSVLCRGLRQVWAMLSHAVLVRQADWGVLRHYPAIVPTDELLQRWNTSCWEEYQRWQVNHTLQDTAAWSHRHTEDLRLQQPSKISIVTPVFNTASNVLYECALSVRMQTYPYWQWILVDDGSNRLETLSLLRSGVFRDPRIKVLFCNQSQGISTATNLAIAEAKGDFVVFLDHDDRLALDALSLIAAEIRQYPDVEIVYSDRDMLSEQGERYLHLFKPGWSPETLLSGNYIFHLMCYKRQLLTRLKGLRAEYDGSQDYDLILRASELQPVVRHIAKILYHWRQHSASVALNVDAKDYAFQAGIHALKDTLVRRGIQGEVEEVPNFWRGTYQLRLVLPAAEALQTIILNEQYCAEGYSAFVKQSINASETPYIAILSAAITPATNETLLQLTAWLALAEVGLATGKVLNLQGQLDYVGIAYNKDTTLMYPYRGFPETEPGYMGVSYLTRNISAPYPTCVVIRREVWQQLGGFNETLSGPLALLDFALRALELGWRSVIVPQCVFKTNQSFVADLCPEDLRVFKQLWVERLQNGDPYYNPNLAQQSRDMGLDI